MSVPDRPGESSRFAVIRVRAAEPMRPCTQTIEESHDTEQANG
jgi:hypothetical protein